MTDVLVIGDGLAGWRAAEAAVKAGASPPPTLRANEHEDNFDDCFRYWEIRSLEVKENKSFILSLSKIPKLPTVKANKMNHKEVVGKIAGKEAAQHATGI